jgi:hypothetical protein
VVFNELGAGTFLPFLPLPLLRNRVLLDRRSTRQEISYLLFLSDLDAYMCGSEQKNNWENMKDEQEETRNERKRR